MHTPPIAGSLRRGLRVSSAAALLACTSAGLAQTAVNVVKPEYRAFAHFSGQPAVAEAFYEADIGAKVSGSVSELLVDVGSRVAAGQVLARLAVPDLVQARNAARAEVVARQSEYDRTTMLAERNSVTQKALAEAQSRLDAAIAAQGEIEAELGYATIQAPFAGTVTARTIDPGDMVYQANSPKGSDEPLFRIAKLDVIRIKTYVPERDAIWVDVDDAATIAFDALPGQMFAGKVSRLSGAIDPGTRTMLVEIDLPNDDGRIRPGLYGQVRIALEQRDRALALPSGAVRYGDGEAYVFVAGSGDVARRTRVQTGLDVGGWVEIVAGLNGDERIVTGAPPGLADGAPLSIAAR